MTYHVLRLYKSYVCNDLLGMMSQQMLREIYSLSFFIFFSYIVYTYVFVYNHSLYIQLYAILCILYHFIAHAIPYCKLWYSGEDFISWKNLCPIPIFYI